MLIVGSVITATSYFFAKDFIDPKSSTVNNDSTRCMRFVPSPKFENNYTPQGMDLVGDILLLAISNGEVPSEVYSINTNTKVIKFLFSMPETATHTSGISWDNSAKVVYAVDNIDNNLYVLDLNKSISAKKAHVNAVFATDRNALGSVANDTESIYITEFIFSRDVYRYDKGSLDFVQRTGDNRIAGVSRFIQGIDIFDGSIFITANKFREDVIMELNYSQKLSDIGVIREMSFPGMMIEDIAVSLPNLWVGDEYDGFIYKCSIK